MIFLDIAPSPCYKYLVRFERAAYRGLVKWYDRGLQNLWWEFDSLIPCEIEAENCDK